MLTVCKIPRRRRGEASEKLYGARNILIYLQHDADNARCAVKFDGENLPLILNALNTENNGQKLVLEVAVWANRNHWKELY